MIPKPLVGGRGANDRKRESERTDERRRPRKVNSLLFFFSRLSFRCPPLLLLRASALGSLRASTRKEGGSPFESGISPDRKKKLTFFPLLFSFCTSTSFPLFLSLFLFLSLYLSLSLSLALSLPQNRTSPAPRRSTPTRETSPTARGAPRLRPPREDPSTELPTPLAAEEEEATSKTTTPTSAARRSRALRRRGPPRPALL